MKKGHSNKLAGQIGEFLVCADLGKRANIATSLTGNVPEFDLIVCNEQLKTIPVQVKTFMRMAHLSGQAIFMPYKW